MLKTYIIQKPSAKRSPKIDHFVPIKVLPLDSQKKPEKKFSKSILGPSWRSWDHVQPPKGPRTPPGTGPQTQRQKCKKSTTLPCFWPFFAPWLLDPLHHLLFWLLDPLQSPLRGQGIPKIGGFLNFVKNFSSKTPPKKRTLRVYKKLVF